MTRAVEADYLVVGAGAMGMAFTDALIDHADVRVALVDRRHGVGGHWLDAYPFVRLHQSSTFYGVASTVLGGGRIQSTGRRRDCTSGPTSRRSAPTTTDVLADRMLGSGRVEFFAGCEYVGDRTFVSRVSGERFEVPERCRIVDARYLAPDIPAETPPQFAVDRRRAGDPGQRPRAARRGPRASTSSWAPARPRPTPASGCWRAESTPTRSAGCGHATPGC